VSRGANVDFC
jgi:hypothetical protein